MDQRASPQREQVRNSQKSNTLKGFIASIWQFLCLCVRRVVGFIILMAFVTVVLDIKWAPDTTASLLNATSRTSHTVYAQPTKQLALTTNPSSAAPARNVSVGSLSLLPITSFPVHGLFPLPADICRIKDDPGFDITQLNQQAIPTKGVMEAVFSAQEVNIAT